MDVGGTLIKIAYFQNDQLQLLKFPSVQIASAAEWVKQNFAQADVCITGGKAALFEKLVGLSVDVINEFDATCRGVLYLLSDSAQCPDSFILTNVGTGTSIHYVSKSNGHSRVGGIGVGGGTMMGLSALLADVHDFRDIVQLSLQGDRDSIDLKVSHIYEGSEPPIPGDLTASNFGRVSETPASSRNASDYLASVIGLIGETVTTVSILAAGQHGVSDIVYIGSSFIDNEMLKKVVCDYTKLRGAHPLILANGEYSGAIGALLDRQ